MAANDDSIANKTSWRKSYHIQNAQLHYSWFEKVSPFPRLDGIWVLCSILPNFAFLTTMSIGRNTTPYTKNIHVGIFQIRLILLIDFWYLRKWRNAIETDLKTVQNVFWQKALVWAGVMVLGKSSDSRSVKLSIINLSIYLTDASITSPNLLIISHVIKNISF